MHCTGDMLVSFAAVVATDLAVFVQDLMRMFLARAVGDFVV